MKEKITTLEQIEYIERQMQWQKMFIDISENEPVADVLQMKRELEILEKIYSNLQLDLMLENAAAEVGLLTPDTVKLPIFEETKETIII